MFNVLKDNKYQFAKLFMDYGLNIGKNWKISTFVMLLKEVFSFHL